MLHAAKDMVFFFSFFVFCCGCCSSPVVHPMRVTNRVTGVLPRITAYYRLFRGLGADDGHVDDDGDDLGHRHQHHRDSIHDRRDGAVYDDGSSLRGTRRFAGWGCRQLVAAGGLSLSRQLVAAVGLSLSRGLVAEPWACGARRMCQPLGRWHHMARRWHGS